MILDREVLLIRMSQGCSFLQRIPGTPKALRWLVLRSGLWKNQRVTGKCIQTHPLSSVLWEDTESPQHAPILKVKKMPNAKPRVLSCDDGKCVNGGTSECCGFHESRCGWQDVCDMPGCLPITFGSPLFI